VKDLVAIALLLKLADSDEQVLGLLSPSVAAMKKFMGDLHRDYRAYKDAGMIYPIAKTVGIPVPDSVPCHGTTMRARTNTHSLDRGGKLIVSVEEYTEINKYVHWLVVELMRERHPRALQVAGFGRECEGVIRKYSGVVDDEFYVVIRGGLFSK
jgi:hypothetical protein